MSIFPKETVNLIADSIGIQIKDDVASLLIEDAEYRIREIINESTKFMKHSNRKKMLPSDINSALTVKNIQPLFGYSNSKQHFKQTNQVYYLEDAEIDLEELVNSPLPPIPLETTFTAHWLAIEGIQPRIVQNPTEKEIKVAEQGPKPVHQQKSQAQTPIVKQVLTKELQLYYEKITESIKSTDSKLQQLAIESLMQDPGIQALMPYFVTFVSDTITANLKNLHICKSMMIMIDSLFKNPHLFMEPYLHQILPAVITCIVAKNLSNDDEDHFTTRKFSALILQSIINNFGTTYHGLQARVTKTLLRALLDESKPLSSLFGALYALKVMGPEVIGLLVIPHVKSLASRISSQMIGVDECNQLLIEICVEHFNARDRDESLLELYGDLKDNVKSFIQ